MATTKYRRKKRNHGVAILIILVASIILGFAVDGGITLIEKSLHPVKYSEYVEKYAEEYNVPVSLVYAIIKTESKFKADAQSSAGAVGLMQFMPDTFHDITTNYLYENLDNAMRYDPETSIKYGTFYIAWIYQNYAHNWETAIAAYNAGIGRVRGWLESAEYSADGKTLDVIPFSETEAYVERVLEAAEKYRELYS